MITSLLEGLPSGWQYVPCGNKKAPRYLNWQTISWDAMAFQTAYRSGQFPGAHVSKDDDRCIQSSAVKAIGVLCGAPSGGLLAFDHDGDSADGVIDRLCKGEEPPATLTISSGKPGRYCSFYRVPEEYWAAIGTTKIPTGSIGPDGKKEALELRWTGAQQVVGGYHPETGEYRWILGPGTPVADAPLWMIEAMVKEPVTPMLPVATSPMNRSTATMTRPTATAAITWKDFSETPLPIDGAFPLALGLTKNHQDLIARGTGDGGRNNAAIALARDLVGVSDRLAQWGQRYEGSAQILFQDFCNRCTPPLSATAARTTWASAQKGKREACLSDAALENCIRAYFWKQVTTKPITKPITKPADDGDDYQGGQPKLAREYKAIERAIGSKLRFNELLKTVELDGKPVSFDRIELDLALVYRVECDRKNIPLILRGLAESNPYNPVADYLNQCGDSFQGNYSEYLQSLCQRLLGATEPLHATYLRLTLISAVARAFRPGCKVDTVLILHGRQGTFKSTFFKVLASPAWFDDSMGSYSDKDEKLKLHRTWITEWAELESAFRRRDVSAIKAFLTTTTDALRPPYGREIEDMKRQGIIVGSTNDSAFLSDPTGNRRFWIIPIPDAVDIKTAIAERDRIWGAAVQAYRAGERWFLSAEDSKTSAEDTDNYVLKDPWESSLRNYAMGRDRLTIPEFLKEQLKFEAKDISQRETMRVAAILSDWQWKKTRTREGGNRNYYWYNPQHVTEAAYG